MQQFNFLNKRTILKCVQRKHFIPYLIVFLQNIFNRVAEVQDLTGSVLHLTIRLPFPNHFTNAIVTCCNLKKLWLT
ncbi:hypothetical protein SLEP1_g29927 [Rubroshorea leprosula]|uniref:Uncharacterized protein n=1 Tax=Rubroshorea leprosula TaxID=152421 RepID=A0AAV5K5B6_9ROSI|nr:hypothetical protein SLEP1_g29927 [Rubroshorea leprosula]